ncbi:murein transglycosylase A [Francisella adeliensis]|uniref:Membrane-bound lytic murein transglycosylase A n=1 Tax=Francisella adeliensis TaxID=2007306 RepID=A0A2Z4XXX8_9GAMM|nr:MltA domain-containing protein [Francisella adeliensis]AXA33639.1 murein transglycosylase [Francisella adeliensis]MBK2085116.1 murein transglycosylase A [Francisella adeliensis]MBK2097407.1 murein transglycosylase A [Francisella adeliensis]QIW11873.1 murein transglycosylase [Francisella adeliensis]QIW13749.1 murein transglycosylase [Francisella adeliensis]
MKLIKKISILVSTAITVSSCLTSCSTFSQKKPPEQTPTKKNSHKITYKPESFADFKNWDNANQLKSFNAFKKSCKKILEENKPKYKSWISVCNKAIVTKLKSKGEAKLFFEENFTPFQIIYNSDDTGTFTGYYEPTMKGSLVKTLQYTVPIYRTPKDLVKIPDGDDFKYGRYKGDKFIPYYTRAEISKGNLYSKKDVLVWVKSKVDRTFLQIQGSGRIETDSGDILVGYDSQNGHKYEPIGRYLLDKNYISRKDMSMQSIKEWLSNNKGQIDKVLNYDPSFVFFRYLNAKNAIGAQGVELTPGYSLAIDDKFHSYGVPMWLETNYYKNNHEETSPLNRLMIAQDTGGAILGAVRGDVFWGHGKQAEYNAGHMNNEGKLWILLPNKENIGKDDKN